MRPTGHSTIPAAPTPIAVTSSCFARSRSMTSRSAAVTAGASESSGVGSTTSASTAPVSSTTPPSIFVPPTSSPIARLLLTGE
jgi:hypothetical protein